MKAIVDGANVDEQTGLIDSLIEDGIFTDIGDLKNPPEDSEIALLFPETSEEVGELIAQVKKRVPEAIIFVVAQDNATQTPEVWVHFLVGKQTPEEFMKAMKAKIRTSLTPDLEKISINIEVNAEKRQIVAGEEVIQFAPSEFDTLNLLLSRPWQVFSKEEIKWATNSKATDEKIVDVWILRIRRKLEEISWLEIETIRGKGYSIKVSDDILLWGKQIKRIENLQFDTMRGRLFSHYNEITRLHLTPREIEIMEVLLINPGKVYHKEFIFNYVYTSEDDKGVDIKIIDVFISKIRDRLWVHRDCVETHWGSGYSFNQKAYEKLVIAKRDFEVGITLDDVYDGEELQVLLAKEYDKDWLMYLKVVTPEAEVASLIRIQYDSATKTSNIEVFDSTGFRSIKQEEAFDIIGEQELEKFGDFYEGVRGFMEVRNQDALTWENTWEHIIKTVSRSGFWEGRVFRWYCEAVDKSIELIKVDSQVYVSVCEKDYYTAFTKTPIEDAATLFSGKYIKKLSISKPSKPTWRKPRKAAVKIMTADGIVEQAARQRTSSRFLDELQAANTFEEKYTIFGTNTTPNLTTFFKVTNGTMRQKQYVVQFSRVWATQEVKIKLYDPASKQLYLVTLEEAKKIFSTLKIEPITVQQNIRQIFLWKTTLLGTPTQQVPQKVSQILTEISIAQLQEKVQALIVEKKNGILLTAFWKTSTWGQFTLTVMKMGDQVQYRVDAYGKTNFSKTFTDFWEVESYCLWEQCQALNLKS